MNLKKYIAIYPLEYCAARFLRQWGKYEEELFKSISNCPDEKSITEALVYFKVARTFLKFKESDSKIKILNALQTVKNNIKILTAEESVMGLANSFKNEFKTLNISAASKLLWLSIRSPVVIYDRRAINALTNQVGYRGIYKNYNSYYVAWKNEYSEFELHIQNAIVNLKNGRSFMPESSFSDADLDQFSKESWFKERVFDIFLWEVGGD